MYKIFLVFAFFFFPLAMEATELLLYYHPKCPYCQYVLIYLEKTKTKIPMVDLQAQPNERTTLKKIGGKAQIPCLIVDGKALYESKTIVDWLQQNQEHPYSR